MIVKKIVFEIEKTFAFSVRFLIVSTFALLFSVSVSAQNDPVEKSETIEAKNSAVEFVSDGCTWFPDGNYVDCCVQHDREYYAGGSWRERWRSDKKLFQCIAAKPKFYNKLVAPIAWLGVRVGGVSWLNARFSWGFGKRKQPVKRKNPPAKDAKRTNKK